MNKIKIEIELKIDEGVASVSSSVNCSIHKYISEKEVEELAREHISKFSKELTRSFIETFYDNKQIVNDIRSLLGQAINNLGVDFEKLKEQGASSDYEQEVLDCVKTYGVDIDDLISIVKRKEVVQ